MNEFSADWLTLRAEADDRARDPGLARLVADRFDGGLVTDLGGGTGATWRSLSPYMPRARWRILDNDAALLAHAPRASGVRLERVDLARNPTGAFFPAPGLMTASAFFDLVAHFWIDRFVDLLAAARTPLYAALTYDGREVWSPTPPHEAEALAAFHADMRRNKGFGAALGPDAVDYLAGALEKAGYRVTRAQSDWRLEAGRDDAMIRALADGAADAIRDKIDDGAHRRWVDGRKTAETVIIGHEDFFAELA